MNDPTGPLADDALMLTATYYQRHKNYVEADRYFEILRDEYPDSRHLEAAFVLGAHVKQMSYQGAYYEGEDLEGARKLKEQSLQLFPVSHQNSQIRKDLDEIYLQEAERLWAMVEYYRRKNRPRAIAIACVRLVSEYPDTGYAREARRLLSEIDRSELAGLPEIPELLEELPASGTPEPEIPARSGPPVKAVSDPNVSGRATL
jgi:outer membrane protein assembly factor BamD (BamD/ComL family)